MGSSQDKFDVTRVRALSIRRFIFFMKAIAENDLWDEVEAYLTGLGGSQITVSHKPIEAIQELLKNKVAHGANLTTGGHRVAVNRPGMSGDSGLRLVQEVAGVRAVLSAQQCDGEWPPWGVPSATSGSRTST